MNGEYYEFLALNNQLIVLDYAIGTALFAVVENKGEYEIQKYVFWGQFWDSDGTWYVLDAIEKKRERRVCILKEKEIWFRTQEEAKVSLWERRASVAVKK